MAYNVVFEGIEDYEGIRTWTTYGSREEFEQEAAQKRNQVIAEGISDDEARALCRKTSGVARAQALKLAIQKHPELRDYLIENALFAVKEEGTLVEFLQELERP